MRKRPPRSATGTGWSLEVGVVIGIPIRIHFTFFLLLLWFGFVSQEQGAGFVHGVAAILLVFASVVLHELGHAAMALRFGVRTSEIVLYPIGGLARLQGMPGGVAELLIAAAGPAVNLVIAGFLALLMMAFGIGLPQGAEELMAADALIPWLLVANLALFAFNLIPAFPMDGGRILRAALSLAAGPARATKVAAAVGQSFAVLFAVLGVMSGNLLLLLIAVFVFFGAGHEAAVSHRQVWLRGRTAADAMISRFERLAPQDSLGRAAQLLLRTPQNAFPVIDAWGRPAGVLTRAEILAALSRLGPDRAVLELSPQPPLVVGADADLADVIRALQGAFEGPVLVADDSGVIGMITAQSLSNLVAILSRSERG